jgi:hypothetical protein
MSIDTAKAERYRYFFCTGQKRQRNRAPTGCREPYAPTDRVEVELDRIYQRVQLPADLVARIEEELQAEIATRQRHTVEERDRHTTRLLALDAERHKLLDAYYANAVPLDLLKVEQDRISRETHRTQQRLDDLNADLDQWRDVLTLAVCASRPTATPPTARPATPPSDSSITRSSPASHSATATSTDGSSIRRSTRS